MFEYSGEPRKACQSGAAWPSVWKGTFRMLISPTLLSLKRSQKFTTGSKAITYQGRFQARCIMAPLWELFSKLAHSELRRHDFWTLLSPTSPMPKKYSCGFQDEFAIRRTDINLCRSNKFASSLDLVSYLNHHLHYEGSEKGPVLSTHFWIISCYRLLENSQEGRPLWIPLSRMRSAAWTYQPRIEPLNSCDSSLPTSSAPNWGCKWISVNAETHSIKPDKGCQIQAA